MLDNRIAEKLLFQLFAENLLAAGLFFSGRTEPTLYYMHMVAFFCSNARKVNIQMKFGTAEGKNCETCEKMPAYDIELNTHSRRQTQQPLPLTGNESLRACVSANVTLCCQMVYEVGNEGLESFFVPLPSVVLLA